jgi:hypothetical protein
MGYWKQITRRSAGTVLPGGPQATKIQDGAQSLPSECPGDAMGGDHGGPSAQPGAGSCAVATRALCGWSPTGMRVTSWAVANEITEALFLPLLETKQYCLRERSVS